MKLQNSHLKNNNNNKEREREERNEIEIEILTEEVGLGRKTIGLNGTRLRED